MLSIRSDHTNFTAHSNQTCFTGVKKAIQLLLVKCALKKQTFKLMTFLPRCELFLHYIPEVITMNNHRQFNILMNSLKTDAPPHFQDF